MNAHSYLFNVMSLKIPIVTLFSEKTTRILHENGIRDRKTLVSKLLGINLFYKKKFCKAPLSNIMIKPFNICLYFYDKLIS